MVLQLAGKLLPYLDLFVKVVVVITMLSPIPLVPRHPSQPGLANFNLLGQNAGGHL
jgi:hypothetical protein